MGPNLAMSVVMSSSSVIGIARLSQDRTGVKLRAEAVDGHACLGVARAEGPPGRVRSAMPRQQRVVEVDRAEPGERQDVGRNAPGEAAADDEIGLERRQHRRPALRMVGDDDVDPGRDGRDDLQVRRAAPPLRSW